jgi:hypothetical protein
MEENMDILKKIEITEMLASLHIKGQCIQQLGTRVFNPGNSTNEDYQQICNNLKQICEGYINIVTNIKDVIPNQTITKTKDK